MKMNSIWNRPAAPFFFSPSSLFLFLLFPSPCSFYHITRISFFTAVRLYHSETTKTKGKMVQRKSAVLFNNSQLFPWQHPDKSSKSQMHLWPSFWKGCSNLSDGNWTSKMGIKVLGGPLNLLFRHPNGWTVTILLHSLNKNNKKNHNSQIFLSNANVESYHSPTLRQ